MKVYFLPGMCVNGKVFDNVVLPEGYEKVYIEWLPPGKEAFEEYVRKMAAPIKADEPFILAGYSMGGIIMQEMNAFLKPEKNILISSIKMEEEIPPLFHIMRKTHLNRRLPQQIYEINSKIAHLFAQAILLMTPEEIERCVAYTSADYLRWAIHHITAWQPKRECPDLFHIHGTKDAIFPFRLINGAFAVKGGDHMMILRKTGEINRVLSQIL